MDERGHYNGGIHRGFAMPGYIRQGHRSGGGRSWKRSMDLMQKPMLLQMQADRTRGAGYDGVSRQRDYSGLYRQSEGHARMDGDDGGTAYWKDWVISGTEQAGKIKFEEDKGNQIE
eukprot:16424762-Heterocapsa_arctica.AAC.1